MVVYQVFNKRIGAWVKMKSFKGRRLDRILNVKQANPGTPFKGVRKK